MSSKLGFYDLMNIAEQNAEQTAKVAKNQKFASFACPKPTKLDPKQKVLSNNIQKFLAKKKEEEVRQQEEEKRKKAKLLELRSHDKKATKRVGQMLRMTKSANKSVLAEAKNSLEDSLVEQDGYQPDEDDYGYVSQHAAEYHKKMMEKYRALPANKPLPPKTHGGVAVAQGQSLTKSKPSEEHYEATTTSASVDTKNSRKPKQKQPPPYNFDALLKLAEVNSKEPIKVVEPLPSARKEEKFEFGRPMTAKEKAEYKREKEARDRIQRGLINKIPNPPVVKPPVSTKPAKDPKTANPSASRLGVSSVDPRPGPSKVMNSVAPVLPPPPPPSSAPVKPSAPVNNVKKPKLPLRQSEQESQPAQQRINAKTAKPIEHESSRTTDRNQAQLKRPFVAHDRTHLPREAEKKPKPSSSKFATRELDRQASRHPPPPPIISKNARNEATSRENRMHPKPIRETRPQNTSYSTSAKPKGRQIIISDEEDEYDSEMDDFIDDSDVNPSQISDLIRNITGYDKHKYKDTSDDECMESNVWQQMREEQKSLRIGIQEDLEDIRREEEEKKRKALMKKKKFK